MLLIKVCNDVGTIVADFVFIVVVIALILHPGRKVGTNPEVFVQFYNCCWTCRQAVVKMKRNETLSKTISTIFSHHLYSCTPSPVHRFVSPFIYLVYSETGRRHSLVCPFLVRLMIIKIHET